MEQIDSDPAGSGRTATILALKPAPLPPADAPAVSSARAASDLLDEAGEMVAQAMGALLRLRLDGPGALGQAGVGRSLASSFELSQLVGHFLKIRDPEERRYCLAVLRSCALAGEGAAASPTSTESAAAPRHEAVPARARPEIIAEPHRFSQVEWPSFTSDR